ncbi:hypothetical protein FRC12_024907 [Ceratobasidium sp. 428]|nr:hypothetical protein FRC12_024907 [Ceratobasidium sp. 428]
MDLEWSSLNSSSLTSVKDEELTFIPVQPGFSIPASRLDGATSGYRLTRESTSMLGAVVGGETSEQEPEYERRQELSEEGKSGGRVQRR